MITNETAKSTYTVISGKDDYVIGFLYKTNPDGSPQIKVYVNKLSESPLVYGADYTLSDDGTKVILAEVNAGDRLDIIRDIPMVQLSDYHIGRIDPDQIEGDMDMAVMRDQQLKSNLDFAIEIPEDHEARIQECEIDISGIESLIPAQTTESNKLADKDFVNSSIATSTATFKGTYSTLEELEAVTATVNDYGFVVSTDATGNTVYSRYKYNGTAWMFEYNLNNSSFTAEQWAAINSGITAGIVDTFDATGHNIGDIFWTMRTDNTLNGAVECDGSQYNTTDFTGGESIGAQLEAGHLPYMSLADYATALATDGSVGAFGWDGTGTTAFRVPSLNDIFIETGTAAQIGDYLTAGVPNIKGYFTANPSGTPGTDGALITTTDLGSSGHGNDGSGPHNWKFEIDASRLAGVYDDNVTTVQPNAVRYRAMVQLAISATDEALETCTAITAQVATNTSDISTLQGYDYVVQSQLPTAQNNYTWYRKYKSGWVEQGGKSTQTATSSVDATITLPVEMQDTEYNVTFSVCSSVANDGAESSVLAQTVTTISLHADSLTGTSGTKGFIWEVKGMATTNN